MTQAARPAGPVWHVPRRVAYVVDQAWPHAAGLEALRSHQIARALVEAGQDVIVFAPPGWPWIAQPARRVQDIAVEQWLDNVRYVCLPLTPQPGAPRMGMMRAMAGAFGEAFGVFRPAAVLSAAPWQVAEAARRAAVGIGAAFFLEQRASLAAGATGQTLPAEAAQDLELACAARRVFALSDRVRASLIAHGVPDGRIALVPHGQGLPSRTNRQITPTALGVIARRLLGHVGPLDHAGDADLLLDLVAHLRAQAGGDVAALIVGVTDDGDGPALAKRLQALRAKADARGLGAHVHLQALSDLRDLDPYLALCSALIQPQTGAPAPDLPLLPYLAAAHGRPVLMSAQAMSDQLARDLPAVQPVAGGLAAWCAAVTQALDQMPRPAAPVLDWAGRIAPLLDQLRPLAQSASSALAGVPGGQADPGGRGAVPHGQVDVTFLPSIGLRDSLGTGHEVRVGPRHPHLAAAPILWASRANLLDLLACQTPGRFVIDWAGLQCVPVADWALLWSTEDMRLNRQIRDAVRLALDRGWRVQVIGPVARAEAPLYRSVAALVEDLPSDWRLLRPTGSGA